MKRSISLLAVILCIMAGICACTPKEEEEEHKTNAQKKLEETKETEEKTEEKEYQRKLDAIEPSAYGEVSGLKLEAGSYLSIIGKGNGGEFWEQVKKGAEQAVADINEELGYKGKDAVKVTYSGPAEAGDVDEQVNILDEELARYPVGLSISIADAKACGVQFDLAAENGIPIVAFDSGSDYQGLMATVSTDNKGTAGMAADRMAELIGDKGEVLVFVQDSGSMSAREREEGFTERLGEAHPEMQASGVYYMDQLEEKKKELAEEKKLDNPEEITEEEVLDELFKKHPDVKGILATDGNAVQTVLETLERLEKKDVKVIGYDGNQEEIEALEDGRLDGLIIQNPFGMGYASVVASARAALSMGNEAYVNTDAMWVTKENLDSDEVKGWLYSR